LGEIQPRVDVAVASGDQCPSAGPVTYNRPWGLPIRRASDGTRAGPPAMHCLHVSCSSAHTCCDHWFRRTLPGRTDRAAGAHLARRCGIPCPAGALRGEDRARGRAHGSTIACARPSAARDPALSRVAASRPQGPHRACGCAAGAATRSRPHGAFAGDVVAQPSRDRDAIQARLDLPGQLRVAGAREPRDVWRVRDQGPSNMSIYSPHT
jgi:hypothetical protein